MRYRYCLLIFLIAVTIIRILYILGGPFGLIPDEAHYWEWSRRLDLSYYSKGPAVAYIIAFFTTIFGDTELGVRIGAVLISIVVSILLYVMTKDIFRSERAAFFAAVVPNLTPVYSVGSVLMTTDPPFIMFWGLCIYLIRNAVKRASRVLWYMAGVAAGLGLLSKYTMALIFPSILLYLLSDRRERGWLYKKEPYIALIISIMIFSPVILWNMDNDWVTIKHTMGQAHVEAGISFSINSVIEFIGGQAGLITPLIFLALIYAIVKCGISGYRLNNSDHLLLFFASIPLLLLFLIKSGQGKVQGNWTAAGYFAAFIAAGGVWDELYTRYQNVRWHGGWARVSLALVITLSLALGAVASVIVHYPQSLEYIGVHGIVNRAPYNRIIGWREAGREVGNIYAEMNRKRPTFIFADRYQTASELAFYIPEKPVVYNVYLGDRRMNQYDLWPGFSSFIGRDALYVKGGQVDLERMIADAFDRCEGERRDIYGKWGLLRVLTVFRCYDFKGIKGVDNGWSY